MRSTDYISKGTAVARLYKARESLLMDKDCRKGLGICLGAFCKNGPGWLICLGSFCVSMWDSGYPLIRGAKISWYSKGSTVPLNLTFINKK